MMLSICVWLLRLFLWNILKSSSRFYCTFSSFNAMVEGSNWLSSIVSSFCRLKKAFSSYSFLIVACRSVSRCFCWEASICNLLLCYAI